MTESETGRGEAGLVRRRGRPALPAALLASLLAHAALLWWNPSLPAFDPVTVQRPAVEYRDRFLALDDDAATTPPEEPGTAPGVAGSPRPVEEAGDTVALPATAPARLDAAVADRLRYQPGPVWAPPAVVYESYDACRQRELTERLAAGIADPRRGVVAPPDARARAEAGVRIPVGRRPPPPPRGVTAPPLPDSLVGVLPDVRGIRSHRVEVSALAHRPPGCGEPSDTLPRIGGRPPGSPQPPRLPRPPRQ